jgi:hypothetical protein
MREEGKSEIILDWKHLFEQRPILFLFFEEHLMVGLENVKEYLQL